MNWLRTDRKPSPNFLKTLMDVHPHARMVATALPEQIGGLQNLGFSPLALMGWDARHQKDFIRNWGEQWERFVITEAWTQDAHESIDTILLDAWLAFGNQHLTPLELTLKVWGGYRRRQSWPARNGCHFSSHPAPGTCQHTHSCRWKRSPCRLSLTPNLSLNLARHATGSNRSSR